MINGESITERVRHLERCIESLRRLQGFSREAYLADMDIHAATERYFQVAIECCLDVAKHIIAGRGLERPTELKQVFQVLAKAGLLEETFADKMTGLARLRNRLVHLYMTVEPDKMFAYLQEDIPALETFASFAAATVAAEQKDLNEAPPSSS